MEKNIEITFGTFNTSICKFYFLLGSPNTLY